MKFADSLAIIAYDKGGHCVRNSHESVWSGERIDFQLVFELELQLCLLLECLLRAERVVWLKVLLLVEKGQRLRSRLWMRVNLGFLLHFHV